MVVAAPSDRHRLDLHPAAGVDTVAHRELFFNNPTLILTVEDTDPQVVALQVLDMLDSIVADTMPAATEVQVDTIAEGPTATLALPTMVTTLALPITATEAMQEARLCTAAVQITVAVVLLIRTEEGHYRMVDTEVTEVQATEEDRPDTAPMVMVGQIMVQG